MNHKNHKMYVTHSEKGCVYMNEKGYAVVLKDDTVVLCGYDKNKALELIK